ncbi:MAG TPA: sugar ABC transporter permease [Candidatus Limnocylindrales bacterium]|jgi:multiple sugar transport system permease protein|nr:sugar ABC transporter permease [Candidatus Limnocylindrales bacterium]
MTAGAAPLAPPDTPRRPTTTSRRRRIGEKWYTPYLFILPHLAIFLVFVGWPFIFGLIISFQDFFIARDRQGIPAPWVGLKHYIDLFTPGSIHFGRFWQTLWNTVLFVIISVPTLVGFSLALAALLNGRFPGRNLFRSVYFAPWTLSVAVIGLLWWWIFQSQGGLITNVLTALGLPAVGWLTSQPWAWLSLLIATVWWTIGFNTIILLAGMQAISRDLYEASAIDGANKWQQFKSITVPSLRPILLLVITLQVIASFNLVGQPQIITNGGPPTAQTTPVLLHIYNVGFAQIGRFELSVAAAMSFLVALIMVAVSVINFRIFRSDES